MDGKGQSPSERERASQFRDTADAVTMRIFPQGQHNGTTPYFFTRDHLGSVREVLSGGGTVVARYDYDPYGRSMTILGTTPTDMNFTGLYRHSKSNLDLAVYRAYDPDLARWLNRDPIGETGGLHLYAYVRNDPAKYIDPSGLMPDEQAIIGPYDPQRYNLFPPPDWHINRNRNNRCPRREPRDGSCSRNNTWDTDPQWYAETKAGPGGHTYRGKDGSECVYDANGNLLSDAGTYNYASDPYSVAHTLKDVLPHFVYGGGYTPGLTDIY